ncbi:hypothetical protein [Nocardioides sp. AE5]|nr:hypothetical protein [Nocardioides sp. AE5]MDT0202862.1 hypothetical protein [Nocardioides sp. AE5]
MYEMYPDWSLQEWGPAKNDPDSPQNSWYAPVTLDQRDKADFRPDDN